ncbi:MAG: ABC transporter ATP-binding protein [Clostridia bacterium]|nr:ABC transporter ATP-binding protein [Clostridia bacterium]
MKLFLTNFKKLWQYAKKDKSLIIRSIIFNIVFIAIRISVILVSAKLIIKLTDNDMLGLLITGIIVFVIELSHNTIYYFLNGCYQKIYKNLFKGLQSDLSEEILKIENECLDKNSSGLFIQRITNDTNNLATSFKDFLSVLGQLLSDIGIYITIFILNKYAFIYFIICTIIIFFIALKKEKKYSQKEKSFKEENERTTSFISEIVRGSKDIKMLNAYASFNEILNNKVESLNMKRYELDGTKRIWDLIFWYSIFAYRFLLIVLIILLVRSALATIEVGLVLYNSMSKVTDFIKNSGELFKVVKGFNLSCERVFSIMDDTKFTKEKFGTKHLTEIDGNFEFKNVSFSYVEGKSVLNKMSFKINSKETVAFVGKSGVGKSTIFSLLCKMYNNYDGEIKVDGINIKELDRDSIRGNITIISQNPYIFNMSIRDNLKLVKKDLTDEEMINVCKMVYLDDFINSLPEKYETIVGESGVMLSGGQRQRLAIARALIQKTEIILFDEATSALDNETQFQIQKAIDNLKREYTILIIAHRLSTIKNADRILFIDNGKIIQEGKHADLLVSCKEYKKLYDAELIKA